MDNNKYLSSHTNSNEGQGPFLLFVAIFALLAWQVTRPLMMAMIWAGMVSFTVAPAFKYISHLMKDRFRSIAAAITLLLLAILFVAPLIIISASLGNEIVILTSNASTLLSKIEIGEAKNATDLIPTWLPEWANEYIRSFLNDSNAVRLFIQKFVQWIGGFLTALSKSFIQGASSFLFDIMLILMVSFFFIRDGEKIMAYIKSATPLSANEKEAFFSRAKNLLNSVIYGILLTVAFQAILGGLGWWFVGLDNPAFFGMLMFFFGMFPAGTAIIWIPGSLYLFLTGDIKNAVILLLWGAAVVGTVDNVLRPFLISGGGKGEEIPTLLIILGLFGGLIKWGVLGVFLGPLVLVLFILVFDIYRTRCLKKNSGTTC